MAPSQVLGLPQRSSVTGVQTGHLPIRTREKHVVSVEHQDGGFINRQPFFGAYLFGFPQLVPIGLVQDNDTSAVIKHQSFCAHSEGKGRDGCFLLPEALAGGIVEHHQVSFLFVPGPILAHPGFLVAIESITEGEAFKHFGIRIRENKESPIGK